MEASLLCGMSAGPAVATARHAADELYHLDDKREENALIVPRVAARAGAQPGKPLYQERSCGK